MSRIRKRPQSNARNLNLTHEKLLKRQNSDKFKNIREAEKGLTQEEIGSRLLEENEISLIKKSAVVEPSEKIPSNRDKAYKSMFKFSSREKRESPLSAGKSLLNRIMERKIVSSSSGLKANNYLSPVR